MPTLYQKNPETGEFEEVEEVVAPKEEGPVMTPVPQEVVDKITPKPFPGQEAVKPAGVWLEGVNADGMPILTYTPTE